MTEVEEEFFLDKAVAEAANLPHDVRGDARDRVFLLDRGHDRTFTPSCDWTDAMFALEPILANATHSRRQRFYRAVQEALRLESGSVPAWPDVFGLLARQGPKAVCKAVAETWRDRPPLL